jgi:CPA2 family monovalent cation:H+ antiporter-2
VPHDATLIATVAVGFMLAFAFGYLAERLRLPPLVGYLVAGIAVGPFTPGFVADGQISGQLAEMGVILLMFGVGLHFSAADLMAVRMIAIPGAVGQIILATLLGIGLSHLLGWSFGAGIVFGLSLAVASTVVLLKALEERNLLDTPAGRVAVGWLIVEDLAMVLVLVLLPAFSVMLGGHALGAGGDGHGAVPAAEGSLLLTLAVTLGKVGAFGLLAMLLGPKVVPWLLARVARTGSRELFTLSVLAVAIGIAFGSAEIFGVSFALGAFFAGVVLSESDFSHRAAADSLPLQDAFSVLFFVSVGMLFDPSILIREPLSVLAVLALIILGKGVISLALVLLLRFPVNLGLVVSAGLAQVGEFSFILIGLGFALGLLPAEGRDLVLAGALFSIALNPVVFTLAGMIQTRIRLTGSPALKLFGQPRLAELEGELATIRQRNEARHDAKAVELNALLELFPVLASVSGHELDELLLMFQPKTATPGTKVIRKGDRPDGMYFISSGVVEIDAPERRIRLSAGAFFGEMALLAGTRRTADVSALDYCRFLVLERRDFDRFMSRHPQVRAEISQMAEERRRRNQQVIDEAVSPLVEAA